MCNINGHLLHNVPCKAYFPVMLRQSIICSIFLFFSLKTTWQTVWFPATNRLLRGRPSPTAADESEFGEIKEAQCACPSVTVPSNMPSKRLRRGEDSRQQDGRGWRLALGKGGAHGAQWNLCYCGQISVEIEASTCCSGKLLWLNCLNIYMFF